jgi:hypothetical protein
VTIAERITESCKPVGDTKTDVLLGPLPASQLFTKPSKVKRHLTPKAVEPDNEDQTDVAASPSERSDKKTAQNWTLISSLIEQDWNLSQLSELLSSHDEKEIQFLSSTYLTPPPTPNPDDPKETSQAPKEEENGEQPDLSNFVDNADKIIAQLQKATTKEQRRDLIRQIYDGGYLSFSAINYVFDATNQTSESVANTHFSDFIGDAKHHPADLALILLSVTIMTTFAVMASKFLDNKKAQTAYKYIRDTLSGIKNGRHAVVDNYFLISSITHLSYHLWNPAGIAIGLALAPALVTYRKLDSRRNEMIAHNDSIVDAIVRESEYDMKAIASEPMPMDDPRARSAGVDATMVGLSVFNGITDGPYMLGAALKSIGGIFGWGGLAAVGGATLGKGLLALISAYTVLSMASSIFIEVDRQKKHRQNVDETLIMQLEYLQSRVKKHDEKINALQAQEWEEKLDLIQGYNSAIKATTSEEDRKEKKIEAKLKSMAQRFYKRERYEKIALVKYYQSSLNKKISKTTLLLNLSTKELNKRLAALKKAYTKQDCHKKISNILQFDQAHSINPTIRQNLENLTDDELDELIERKVTDLQKQRENKFRISFIRRLEKTCNCPKALSAELEAKADVELDSYMQGLIDKTINDRLDRKKAAFQKQEQMRKITLIQEQEAKHGQTPHVSADLESLSDEQLNQYIAILTSDAFRNIENITTISQQNRPTEIIAFFQKQEAKARKLEEENLKIHKQLIAAIQEQEKKFNYIRIPYEQLKKATREELLEYQSYLCAPTASETKIEDRRIKVLADKIQFHQSANGFQKTHADKLKIYTVKELNIYLKALVSGTVSLIQWHEEKQGLKKSTAKHIKQLTLKELDEHLISLGLKSILRIKPKKSLIDIKVKFATPDEEYDEEYFPRLTKGKKRPTQPLSLNITLPQTSLEETQAALRAENIEQGVLQLKLKEHERKLCKKFKISKDKSEDLNKSLEDKFNETYDTPYGASKSRAKIKINIERFEKRIYSLAGVGKMDDTQKYFTAFIVSEREYKETYEKSGDLDYAKLLADCRDRFIQLKEQITEREEFLEQNPLAPEYSTTDLISIPPEDAELNSLNELALRAKQEILDLIQILGYRQAAGITNDPLREAMLRYNTYCTEVIAREKILYRNRKLTTTSIKEANRIKRASSPRPDSPERPESPIQFSSEKRSRTPDSIESFDSLDDLERPDSPKPPETDAFHQRKADLEENESKLSKSKFNPYKSWKLRKVKQESKELKLHEAMLQNVDNEKKRIHLLLRIDYLRDKVNTKTFDDEAAKTYAEQLLSGIDKSFHTLYATPLEQTGARIERRKIVELLVRTLEKSLSIDKAQNANYSTFKECNESYREIHEQERIHLREFSPKAKPTKSKLNAIWRRIRGFITGFKNADKDIDCAITTPATHTHPKLDGRHATDSLVLFMVMAGLEHFQLEGKRHTPKPYAKTPRFNHGLFVPVPIHESDVEYTSPEYN